MFRRDMLPLSIELKQFNPNGNHVFTLCTSVPKCNKLFQPLRWRKHNLPKRRRVPTALHGVQPKWKWTISKENRGEISVYNSVEIATRWSFVTEFFNSKVYWRLNMFRAAHRSSSGALNCICSLWFIYDVVTGRCQGSALATAGHHSLSHLRCTDSWISNEYQTSLYTALFCLSTNDKNISSVIRKISNVRNLARNFILYEYTTWGRKEKVLPLYSFHKLL
jgi:hypothetical protein